MNGERGKPEKFILNIDEKDYNRPEVARASVPREKKKKKKKRSGLRALIWVTVIVAVSVTLAVSIVLFMCDVLAIARTDEDVDIDFPKGATTKVIADILHENGIINYPFGFRIVSKLSDADGTYNYGLYTINTSDSYAAIIEKLQVPSNRHVETVRITFKEGLTLGQMGEVVAEVKDANGKQIWTKEQFLKACEKDYDFEFEKYMQQSFLRLKKYEGYLYPDTYEFFVDDNAEVIVKRMLTEFQEKIVIPLRDQIDKSGMTFDQVITLASIVQAEAGAADQMAGIAGVFRNRLDNPDKFPKLESCVTRDYANDVVAVYTTNQEQLDGYNTYVCYGLPAGPICNPFVEAVKAVLEPERNGYFYFCHNTETKEIFYGRTLSEHEQNMRKAGLA